MALQGGAGKCCSVPQFPPPILIVGRIKCIDMCIVLRTVPGPTRTSSVFAVVADAIVIQPWLWRAWAGHRTKPCGFAHVDYSWPHASRLGLPCCQAVQPPMRTSKTPSSALVLSPPLPRYHQWRVDAHTNDRCRHMSGGCQILRIIASGPHFPTAVPCPLTLPRPHPGASPSTAFSLQRRASER